MEIADLLKIAGMYGPLGVWAFVVTWAFWRQLEKTETAHNMRLADHKELIEAARDTRLSMDKNTQALQMLALKIEKISQ